MDDFLIARNPEEGTSLPYLLRIPLGPEGVVLKARDTWPRTGKIYCHRAAGWPRDPEIVEAPTEADAVGPGMLVTVRPLDDDDPEEETYLLAEHAEEKASGARTVTTTSPFGSALMGVAEGEEIVYQAPGGSFRYVVVGFEPHTG